jgi:hypothetical protein
MYRVREKQAIDNLKAVVSHRKKGQHCVLYEQARLVAPVRGFRSRAASKLLEGKALAPRTRRTVAVRRE